MNFIHAWKSAIVACALGLVSCVDTPSVAPNFQTKVSSTMPLHISTRGSARLLGFANQDTQLVVSTSEPTTYDGAPIQFEWWNTQTGKVEHNLTVPLPQLERFTDVTWSATENKLFFLTRHIDKGMWSLYQHDTTKSVSRLEKIRDVSFPPEADLTQEFKLQFGSSTWLVGAYKSGTDQKLWATTVDGKVTVSTTKNDIWYKDQSNKQFLVAISPDQNHLALLTHPSWETSYLELFTLTTDLPRYKKFPYDFYPDGKFFFLSNQNIGVIKQEEPNTFLLDIDLNLQSSQQTLLPLTKYKIDQNGRKTALAISQILPSLNGNVAIITTYDHSGYTENNSLFLWNKPKNLMKDFNICGGSRFTVEPLGKNKMLVFGVCGQNATLWQWNESNSANQLYDVAYEDFTNDTFRYVQQIMALTSTKTGVLFTDHEFVVFEDTENAPLRRYSKNEVSYFYQSAHEYIKNNQSAYLTQNGGNYCFENRACFKANVFSRLAVSPSGRCVAGSPAQGYGDNGSKGVVEIWCTQQNPLEEQPKPTKYAMDIKASYSDLQGNVSEVSWSPDGQWIFARDDRGDGIFWNVFAEPILQHKLSQKQSPVVGSAWMHDNVLATVQKDGTLTLWHAPEESILLQQSLGQEYTRASFVETPTGLSAILQLADGVSVQRLSIDQVIDENMTVK